MKNSGEIRNLDNCSASGGRTHTILRPTDFKSVASAYSAIAPFTSVEHSYFNLPFGLVKGKTHFRV